MSKRDDLAHRIIDSLDRHGDSYGLVKGPSDLAYLVADDLLAAPSPALTREALAAYLTDCLRAEEATRGGNARTIAGQVAFLVGWLTNNVPPDILAALGTPPPAPTSTREENL